MYVSGVRLALGHRVDRKPRTNDQPYTCAQQTLNNLPVGYDRCKSSILRRRTANG